ncbi:proline dehydrogenase [Gordonia desulfuricans]|uniref:proline dehydrogenase n=1 Tax=Gordonia desulfuricans TaxID=89051 RepID=A0A7K3LWM7_9ACTN|nr:proline dehydrogenase family protein [Gordonia desulfuricans]NDK92526.1 proline dehydrogenase [Gordonia desulfuricans]
MSTAFDSILRPVILRAAAADHIKNTATRLPVTARVVDRFVAGETQDDVLSAVAASLAGGLSVSVDHLGEATVDEADAAATVRAYLSVLESMSGLEASGSGRLEVSLKLTALGQSLPRHGRKMATENARTICAAAHSRGVLVTIDAEDHSTVSERLDIVRELRRDFDDLGTVLQAYLRRTEDDCREFAASGARIRLCKGAYAEPPSVAFDTHAQVDDSYLRCLRILMHGNGHPMVASHDPTMIEAAQALAHESGRSPESWEHQMLFGIRSDEQRRLADAGAQVRVYIPYGSQWYGYFVRRLAERPANLLFFLRALAERQGKQQHA